MCLCLIGWATNIKRDTFCHFGSMAIPQSSKIEELLTDLIYKLSRLMAGSHWLGRIAMNFFPFLKRDIKIMIHELLGFDIRLRPKYYVEKLWNQERRVTYLLLPEVKWPLSVDKSENLYFIEKSVNYYYQTCWNHLKRLFLKTVNCEPETVNRYN